MKYLFDQENIVKGSDYVTAQCCGNSEIELGTVYAAEMGISLFPICPNMIGGILPFSKAWRLVIEKKHERCR